MQQQNQQRVTALLVIDVQKGLFEKPTPIHRAEQVLENISYLIDQAHRKNMPVVYIQHSSPKALEKGSSAWQLHAQIHPRPDDILIHKRHANAFEETNLREELEKRKVSSVVVTGLVTHGCVKATCLGAIEEGYHVVLVRDGHSSYSNDAAELIEKWNQALHEKGADLLAAQKVRFSSN